MSILTEKKDLEAVIEEVKSWDFVDQNRIIVMGYSQGGLVAGLTVSERTDIERLLLIFPAFSMPQEIIDTYKNKEIPSTIHRMGMKIGKKYVTDILSLPYDVYEEGSKYKGKTLIIHGIKDHLVPYESSVKLSKMYGCELYTLEGGDHGFTGTKYDLPFLKKSYRFLEEE